MNYESRTRDDRTMAAVTTIVTSHFDSKYTQARLSFLVYRDASTRTRAKLSMPS